jgi:predicted nucleic acid-binding protein
VTVFIDSNIPMYLVGAPHPNKDASRVALERAVADGERLVTDAEVLQEILHRYAAIGRRDAIEPALDLVIGIVDEVYAIDADLVRAGARLLDRVPRLSARDALHAAVMRHHRIDDILTFDAAFDDVGGLRRRPA